MTTAEAIRASAWCRGCSNGGYVTGLVPIVEPYFDRYTALPRLISPATICRYRVAPFVGRVEAADGAATIRRRAACATSC